MPPANPFPIEFAETSTNCPSTKLLTERLLPTLYCSGSDTTNSLDILNDPRLFFFENPFNGLFNFLAEPKDNLTDLYPCFSYVFVSMTLQLSTSKIVTGWFKPAES